MYTTYDYLVKENNKVYAVRLEESGSLVVDVEGEKENRGVPFKDDGVVTEVGNVRFARVGLYDVMEAKDRRISGEVLWFPHFLGPYALAYDYGDAKLFSVDLLTGRAEPLLDEVGKFLPFKSKTCCGVEELRFLVLREGRTSLYSFTASGELRLIKKVGYPFTDVKDEVAFHCERGWCRLMNYNGDVIRVRGVFKDGVLGAKFVEEMQSVLALTREMSRVSVISASEYALLLLQNGYAVTEAPIAELKQGPEYSLSDASQYYALLHATSSDEDARFELYDMTDVLNEVPDIEPVMTFGYVPLEDEAVLVGDKIYFLNYGKPQILEA